MPIVDDESFEIGTVTVDGDVYVKLDDLVSWVKDAQNNGLDKDTTHWMLMSLIACKNSIKQNK